METQPWRRARIITAAALVLAALLSAGVRLAGQPWNELLGSAVFWVPMLIAAILCRRELIALRVRPIDLLWGVGVGLLARAVASVTDGLVYGHPVMVALPALPALVITALTIVIVAPLVEELFFRGLVLPTVRGDARGTASSVVAVIASAVIFALMHVIAADTPQAALATGIASLTLGVGTGILAVTTNRLGGAILSHAVFNGSVIVMSLAATGAAPTVQ